MESSESFDTFIEENTEEKPINEEHNIIENKDVMTLETDDDVLTCPYCNYVPRSHCKDKQKAIQNHIKKKHPEKLNSFLNNNTKKVKKSTPIEVSETIENINCLDEDEEKLKIVQDLDILKIKFPNLYNPPSYSYPESSLEHLKRIKATYKRLISDKMTCNMAMNLLVAFGKGAERVSGSLGVCDLDGYADNIARNDEEFKQILDELMESNMVNLDIITPDVKLGIALLSCGIKTAESNKIQKNSQSIDDVVPS